MPRPKNVKPIKRVTSVHETADTEQVIDAIQEVKVDPPPLVVDTLGRRIVMRHCTKSFEALDGHGRPIMGANGHPVQTMKEVDEPVVVLSSLLTLEEAQLFDKAGWWRMSDQWTRKAKTTTGIRRLVINNDVYEAL
jgi:hypothetical protein